MAHHGALTRSHRVGLGHIRVRADSWPDPISSRQSGRISDGLALDGWSGRTGAGPRRVPATRVKKRLGEYRRYGEGEPIAHAGGRYIWQLKDSSNLLVAWLQTPGQDPKLIEDQFIAEFAQQYGKRPFANLNGG